MGRFKPNQPIFLDLQNCVCLSAYFACNGVNVYFDGNKKQLLFVQFYPLKIKFTENKMLCSLVIVKGSIFMSSFILYILETCLSLSQWFSQDEALEAQNTNILVE